MSLNLQMPCSYRREKVGSSLVRRKKWLLCTGQYNTKGLCKLELYPKSVTDYWIDSKMCNRQWQTAGDQGCKRGRTQWRFKITYFFFQSLSDLLNVDQLTDVHVIITVTDIRPDCLYHLPNNRNDDVPPRQRQRLTVQQLLQQCHHVAVVGWAEQGSKAWNSTLEWLKQ